MPPLARIGDPTPMRLTAVGGLIGVVMLGQVRVAAAQEWWDAAWPYRVEVEASGSGVVEADVDFGAELTELGLNRAILDVRSLRVVPYAGEVAGEPIPYAESYSVLLDDAEAPQIDWSDSGVYWTVNDGSARLDTSRASRGAGALQAVIENRVGGYGYPGVELHIAAGEPLTDWSSYEAFIYDVWPQVNASALDQAPDLYSFKIYNVGGCDSTSITQGGPALALDRWNRVSVPLNPLHTCSTPDLSEITRVEFHTRDNETVNGNSGLYDDGDELTLWFDDLRLVDQNSGALRWEAADGATSYFVYFDVLDHEGHPPPDLDDPGAATIAGAVGSAEAGGYLHVAAGTVAAELQIWGAPAIEKITQEHAVPTHRAPLLIQAAKNEFEPLQLVVRAASEQQLAVSVSDFVSDAGTIRANNVAIHRVDYVPMSQSSDRFGRIGEWPDPLYPIAAGATVTFPEGQNQPLWFTVYVPPDASAGTYQATITIGTATVPVSLDVWDFALPPDIHLKSEWGFGWSEVVEIYQGTVSGSVQSCYWDLVNSLYEDFAGHRLTPKGVGWPAGLNYPGGVEYDCAGGLDAESWGQWGFADLAAQYLEGGALSHGNGFPSFLIRGPASNWPPDSRPSSFCDESRGDDPPGASAYNTRWFEYWEAVSDYLATSGYAGRGYYHIVNEPQTFEDYEIVAYLAEQTKAVAPDVLLLLSEQVEPAIHSNPSYPGAKIDIWMPTITSYQVERAHDRQLNHGEQVWWYFLYGDRPPLPNPTVIDRAGLEARIIPWLAWAERVDGLLYYSTTDWNPSPWTDAWINDGNGDGFMFYPPTDSTVAFDACSAQSNRLVPSIRWELLREGMEDYEYLWVLNGGSPEIAVNTATDALVAELVSSRTLFSRVPTDVYATRARVAAQITGDTCADECNEAAACEGNTLVVCAADVAGCWRETRTDCAATSGGYCDGAALSCAVQASGTGGASGSGGTAVTGGQPGAAGGDSQDSGGAGGRATRGTAGSAMASAGEGTAVSAAGIGNTGASSPAGGGEAGRDAEPGSGNAGRAETTAGAAGRPASAETSRGGSNDGGCGCRVVERSPQGRYAWLWAAGLLGVARRRRCRQLSAGESGMRPGGPPSRRPADI